jgi:predicted phosphodiesterase
MTTCNDLHHDQQVPGSLEITVYSVNNDPVSPREVELKANDSEGEELAIIIWEKHGVSGDWSVGSTYEIMGGRAQRWEGSSGPDVQVSSNDNFNIERIDISQDATRVLIIGDTHVGYRHRSNTSKPNWAKNVDNKKTFEESLSRARALGVDAVLHAGDVFDHSINQGDRDLVNQEIQRTYDAGIQIYFVRGNHDNQSGNRVLNQSPAIHTGSDNVRIGAESLQVIGLDYCGGEIPNSFPDGAIKSVDHPSIFVIHDTPYPAVDEDDNNLYRNDSNQLDLTDFLDSAANWIDLIVAGHMHVGRRGSIEGYDVPLLVTGPTAPISSYDDESCPSTWLLTISDGDIEIERQTL